MKGTSCCSISNTHEEEEDEEDDDEDEKDDEQEARTHLSGAYIRSLVKQLATTSKRDDQTITDTKIGVKQPHHHHHPPKQQPPPSPSTQQHHKKQVRRRLHTRRPYQKRLLNMAEARREIVTALKFHRASMKNSDQPPQSQPPPPPLLDSPLEQPKLKSRRNPRIYAATTSNSNFPTYQSDVVYEPPPNHHLPPNHWSIPAIAPLPPLTHDNLNLIQLPNQTLGLNLNYQDLNYLVNPYVKMSGDEEVRESGGDSKGLHEAMDEKGMAGMRSLGEEQEMEWKEKMKMVRSAWWFKLMKTMEMNGEEDKEGFHHHPLVDQVMEIPGWLNANNLDDYCCNHYSQDPALPRMEIGDIQGVYEEEDWLA